MKNFLLIIAVFLIMYPFNATAAKAQKAADNQCQPLIEAGASAYDTGSLETAMTFFQKADDKGCKDGLAFFRMGIYYESGGNLRLAKKYLELAKSYLYKKYPKDEATKTISEHLGRVLFSLGEYDNAKRELSNAAQKQGPNFTTMFLLGSIAVKENNDQMIIYYYTEALKYAPPEGTNPTEIAATLLTEIGKAYYDLKEYDKSLAVWNQLLGKFPNHATARQYKSNIERIKMDQFKKSEQKKLETPLFK